MAAHTKFDEKIITIEDTLELHLDKIFPQRDIVAMKTNNIASYADVLVTCMRQNPRWILLSEVRSAEAVMAVRDSISSGHNILSTIHADKAESIPSRLYRLLESSIDMDQFLRSIHRYVQLGVHIKGYYSKEEQRFKREVAEVVEFYVTEDNKAEHHVIYKRTPEGKVLINNPTKYLLSYLESQGVVMRPDVLVKNEFREATNNVINEVRQPQIHVQQPINNLVQPVTITPNITNQVQPKPINNLQNTNANPTVVTPNVIPVQPVYNLTQTSVQPTITQQPTSNIGIVNSEQIMYNNTNNNSGI